jgi:hypothetical protein
VTKKRAYPGGLLACLLSAATAAAQTPVPGIPRPLDPSAEARAQAWIAALDTNKDGKVDEAEFIAYFRLIDKIKDQSETIRQKREKQQTQQTAADP